MVPTDKNRLDAPQGIQPVSPTYDPPIYGQSYDDKYLHWYCTERPLVRPRLTLTKFLLSTALLLGTGLGLGYGTWELLDHPCSLITALWVAAGVTLLASLRMLIINLVKLYQHYAPEWMRRRCMMLPSCSEYCIMAVRKYGVVRGCWKTTYRLTHKCLGHYEVDWP